MKRSTAEIKKQETYNRIDASRPQVCTGCSRGDVPLTNSHLISQQRLVVIHKRPELIADPRLITKHCHSCHTRFENHDPELDDYLENLKIIEQYDPELANFIKTKNNESYGRLEKS